MNDIGNNFKDEKMNELFNSMVILYDTREHDGKNDHILNYLQHIGMEYRREKLGYGDYTCMVKRNSKLNIEKDIYFNDLVCIERKANLNELAINLTKGHERFEREFERSKGVVYLMVEDATYSDIIKGNYRSDLKPKSFLAMLNTLEARWHIRTSFVEKNMAGNFITYKLMYYVREFLKGRW